MLWHNNSSGWVAKTSFLETPTETYLYRGQRDKPLYISSVSFPVAEAKLHIKGMYGRYRLPTILKYGNESAFSLDHPS